jgi:hypothetical protein
MKTIRILVTIALGAYLAAMALQFTAICVGLIQSRTSPFAAEAPAAFFTNFLVCALLSIAIWAMWRGRSERSLPEITGGEKKA